MALPKRYRPKPLRDWNRRPAGCNVDLRPESSVDGKGRLWLFSGSAALAGLHLDRLHYAFTLGGISGQNQIPQHQNPLAHVTHFGHVTLDAIDDDRSRHSIKVLHIALAVRMRVIPIQSRRLLRWHLDRVMQRLPR